MASGFGITGQQGRCYPVWMDFYGCMMETDQPSKCADLREDYFECLHHRKEVSFPFFPRRSDPPAQGQLGLQVPADADAGC
mmetsp:Transcript_4946/g.17808  ORF Transcript_4946/g.17808 Transcript_4946/m.17808 type:complete len:81 (-) Transcript_4946:481-723(-)